MKTALSAMLISSDAKIPATKLAETERITMWDNRNATHPDAKAIDGVTFECDHITVEIECDPFVIDQAAIEIDHVAFKVDRDPFEIDGITFEIIRGSLAGTIAFLPRSLKLTVEEVTLHHTPGNRQTDQNQVQPSGAVESSRSDF